MTRMPARFILATLLLAAAGSFAAESGTCGDGQLIFALPARLEAARKASQEGWDSGVTLEMREATTKYNEALKGMILDLSRTYYAEPAGQEEIDEYAAALATVGQFERSAANPRNDMQGSIVPVEAGLSVSDQLEKTISKMVEALIGEDTHYSLGDWQKQWNAALGSSGQSAETEAP